MPQLHPSSYPWREPVRAGLLGDDGFTEGIRDTDLTGRVPVVAVGSNASPTVLAHKLGELLDTGLPLGEGAAEGLVVGHSAHVSARGYVAAAPAQGAGRQPVTVGWFDAAQLAVLDATEPNYRRRLLPESMPVHLVGERLAGAPLTGVQVYESVHGVLGVDGTPLGLLDQAGVLAWLSERLPGLGDLDHERLADAALREQVRIGLVAAGLTLPSGL